MIVLRFFIANIQIAVLYAYCFIWTNSW